MFRSQFSKNSEYRSYILYYIYGTGSLCFLKRPYQFCKMSHPEWYIYHSGLISQVLVHDMNNIPNQSLQYFQLCCNTGLQSKLMIILWHAINITVILAQAMHKQLNAFIDKTSSTEKAKLHMCTFKQKVYYKCGTIWLRIKHKNILFIKPVQYLINIFEKNCI